MPGQTILARTDNPGSDRQSWLGLVRLVPRSENSGILPWVLILIRVVSSFLIESDLDWIDVGTLGPLELSDSCNMGLKLEPKPR